MQKSIFSFFTGQFQSPRFSLGSVIVYILAGLVVLSIVALKKGWLKSKQGYYPSYIIATIFYHLLFTFVPIFILNIIFADDFAGFVYIIWGVLFLGFSFLLNFLYFLPYRIAHKNNHKNTRAIYILNIFTAWTVIAWVIALVWAHTKSTDTSYIYTNQSNAAEILKYKELYDSGVITKEQFEAKRNQLLDM